MTREAELDGYRKRWEAGDFRAVIDAFEHCHNWTLPLPDWLAGPVLYALHLAFKEGGAPGRGKTGSFATQASRKDMHWWRYLAACTCRSRSAKDLEAARKMLEKTIGEGSVEAIRDSYYKVRKELRNSG
jgi:hypothetical protein